MKTGPNSKNIDQKKLITQHTTSGYQSDFQNIGSLINDSMNYNDWIEVYKKLTYWELELESSSDSGMDEVHKMQKTEVQELRFYNYNEEFRPLILLAGLLLLVELLLRNTIFRNFL